MMGTPMNSYALEGRADIKFQDISFRAEYVLISLVRGTSESFRTIDVFFLHINLADFVVERTEQSHSQKAQS